MEVKLLMVTRLTDTQRQEMKARRLALIKERYRKLILEPRREIELELFAESPEEDVEFDLAN